MFVKLDNTAYMVVWEHGTGPNGQRHTKCGLHELMHKDEEPTRDNVSALPNYEGIAVCSRKDQFCKDTGRKKSLSRALSNTLVFPREVRKKFWEAYFQMTHKSYGDTLTRLKFRTFEKIEV